ncbi:hypothetical protein SAMN02982929_06366 [Saccharopolyspora kobensis]|uniref:Uncharacterized protein n=1 Tax=Saccharopolyspora kobensis TaxID=146035 RepID=A0A1H6EEV0_9PSEU|nr:hypothetical protein SAMN02982929_06366 [Saccharopolyspora kobensis]
MSVLGCHSIPKHSRHLTSANGAGNDLGRNSWVELRPRSAGVHRMVQKTDSSISIRELSAASMILRRPVSSGSTFLAKNRATATLPW